MSNINYMYAALHLGPVPGVGGLVVVEVVGLCRVVAAAPVTAAVSALRSDQSNQGSEPSHVDGGSLFSVPTCSGVPKNGIVSCGARA